MLQVFESERAKIVRSPVYNYNFYKETGYFERWGETIQDDPQVAPAPEIMDIEISAGGKCRARCDFCYKANGVGPHKNMSVEDFENILEKLPPTLTQVALGITDIDAHPQLVEILRACRDRGVVPNFTTNGLAFDKVDLPTIVGLVGAIAVSVYPHLGKDVGYNAVKQLTDLGLEQVNIHLLYHQDNLPFVYEVLWDTVTDWRLQKLNATVLLGLKPKGRAEEGFTPLSKERFTELVKYCFDNDLRIGFDSCSAAKFEGAIESIVLFAGEKARLLEMSERCESTCFSVYVNVDGRAFPCSFTEEGQGVNVLEAENFVRDVWASGVFVDFRNRLLANERKCPVYEID
jgi:MoaA/NifB/PqqE/SkfB family radical SAM enzyme